MRVSRLKTARHLSARHGRRLFGLRCCCPAHQHRGCRRAAWLQPAPSSQTRCHIAVQAPSLKAGNLALACRRCNERRYNFIAGLDPETEEIVPLFHPRRHNWADHFVWTEEGTIVSGITPIGRATCIRLDLNDMRYPEKDSIRSTRRFWLKTQLHPPIGDSRLE